MSLVIIINGGINRRIHINPKADTGYVDSITLNINNVCTIKKETIINVDTNMDILAFKEKFLSIFV